MTDFLLRRRRPAPPRRRIVSVTNRWVVAGERQGREVHVRLPDGRVIVDHLPDSHPALVSFLARQYAAAVAA